MVVIPYKKGFKVVDYRHVEDDVYVVLRQMVSDSKSEYTTHLFNADLMCFTDGRYFNNEADAHQDYLNRQ